MGVVNNILIIEDDPAIREGVRILMEGESFHVEEAVNGFEGLKKISDSTHLVILDVMMPGISGYKTCEEIRDKAAEKKTEIEIQEEWIENKNIRINTEKNSVYLDEKEINLTEMEYKILVLLMKNPGKIFSVQNIYESIWEAPYLYSSGNTVMVHIRRLRKKIEKDPQNPKLIVSTWGKGYHFEKNK